MLSDRILRILLGLAVSTTTWIAGGSVPDAEEGFEFRFSEGPARQWRAERALVDRLVPASSGDWVEMTTPGGTRRAWSGRRLMIETEDGRDLPPAEIRRWGLTAGRRIGERQWILDAGDPWRAAAVADALSSAPGISAVRPVMRRGLTLHGRFARRPSDPHFTDQWHLENRDAAGRGLGPDLRARAAWNFTQGAGITIAICDDGFETTHPDLKTAASGAPHFDFTLGRASAGVYGAHSTCVAGLAGATGDNQVGITGVAPAAKLASWAIFDSFSFIVSDESLHDMFEYRLEDVAVRNHSWGNADATLSAPSFVEATAISNAVALGRGGRGVLMVRSAGNERETSGDANSDGYANDPRVIAVAATRDDGRVASYSNPGACVLVSSLSGDDGDTFAPTRSIYTTDRAGSRGYNSSSGGSDLADYAFGATGFSGTSASAPMISGVVALVLAANPSLTYRDVQQVLLHSARHHDRGDPDIRTNAAGYVVSHNQGFGIPEAGQAVQLARRWTARPPVEVATQSWSGAVSVPDAGFRVRARGGDGSSSNLVAMPTTGVHPESTTQQWPLVSVGLVTNELAMDLRGKAALVERGTSFFRDKLDRVTRAGAAAAVIFNNRDGTDVFTPGGTDFTAIPAALIGENDGRALLSRIQAGEPVAVQFAVDPATVSLVVTNPMLCEHVGVRIRSTHQRRGDLRLELISPTGTRSVLQRPNDDDEAGPADWTYWSTQHFYESSQGTWKVLAVDEVARNGGALTGIELILRGVVIEDADADGLDDGWERTWFGDLGSKPGDDPDGDGNPNGREQILGTDPRRADEALNLDLATFDQKSLMRLSWPTRPDTEYRVLSGDAADGSDTELGRVAGAFPEGEWIVPLDPIRARFFRLEERPR